MASINKYSCMLVREQEFVYNTKLTDSEDVYRFLCDELDLDKKAEEYMYVLALDVKGNLIGIHEISHGTISNTVITPKEVLKRVLLNNAPSYILVHTHPSGDPTPSSEDVAVTEHLAKASKILDIKMYDHIIVGNDKYTSFHEIGEL